MHLVKCSQCENPITTEDEIEYSAFIGDYFCSPKCALVYYIDYMGGTPFDIYDKELIKERQITIKDGKLYKR